MDMNQFSSKKISCVVTGKTTVYAGDFLQKKILEYNSIENLDKFYICKEVKALLKKGYRITDIRKILDTPDYIPIPDDLVIKEIEKDYQKSQIKLSDTSSQTLSTITDLTYDKSDPEVQEFIEKFITKL
jgi:hypothetical protein